MRSTSPSSTRSRCCTSTRGQCGPCFDGGQAVEYIEVTAADIAQANAIAHEVLGRSLDELPPQTRCLLAAIALHVHAQMHAQAVGQTDVRFTRKDVRALNGWGDTQLRVHLERLVSLEHLLAHRDGAGGRFAYELVFDGDAAAAVHLSGLIDAASIEEATTAPKSRGSDPQVAGRLRVDSGAVAAGLRGAQNAANPALAPLPEDCIQEDAQPHVLKLNGKTPSYVPASSLAAEARQ